MSLFLTVFIFSIVMLFNVWKSASLFLGARLPFSMMKNSRGDRFCVNLQIKGKKNRTI